MVVQEVGKAGARLPGEELRQKLEGSCEQGTALLRKDCCSVRLPGSCGVACCKHPLQSEQPQGCPRLQAGINAAAAP